MPGQASWDLHESVGAGLGRLMPVSVPWRDRNKCCKHKINNIFYLKKSKIYDFSFIRIEKIKENIVIVASGAGVMTSIFLNSVVVSFFLFSNEL